MADLTVQEVEAILRAQGIVDVGEDDLVETTHRLNALMEGLNRLEASEAFGDVESWVLFESHRAHE